VVEQNYLEHLKEQLRQGLISLDEANVEMVRAERVRVVNRLTREMRKTLNDAVKSGKLAHMKKDGVKPEVYYHPSFEDLARETRAQYVAAAQRALLAVCR
jgi:GTP-dependent phosphoenolpyruvate carboxykinase